MRKHNILIVLNRRYLVTSFCGVKSKYAIDLSNIVISKLHPRDNEITLQLTDKKNHQQSNTEIIKHISAVKHVRIGNTLQSLKITQSNIDFTLSSNEHISNASNAKNDKL